MLVEDLGLGRGHLAKGIGVCVCVCGGVPIFLGGLGFISIPWKKWWAFLLSFGGLSRLKKASPSYSSHHLRGSRCKLCSLYLTPTIASTEPEHGPNMDLLGTSPKASLGQYATWQVQTHWERVGLQGSFQVCSCLVTWTEAPGD